MAQTYKREFSSISQFYDYICETPINGAFRWKTLKSSDTSKDKYEFTKTHSFKEASELLRNGWDDMAQDLTNRLNVNVNTVPTMKRKSVLSVAGYQPVVALYLAGVPQNMIDTKMVPVKSKIINITKSINYSGGTSTETIIRESIKAMQVVKRLEAQGYRVNLSIALGTAADYRNVLCKVCIKRAGEKLNVSKLAFPMVHPSMLRRLFFRYIEVCPDVTYGYTHGYGHPVEFSDMRKAFPDDVVLPAFWDVDPSEISTLDKLQASF